MKLFTLLLLYSLFVINWLLKLVSATLRIEVPPIDPLYLVEFVIVELPKLSSVFISVPTLVIRVPLLLFLKISFICLKV